MAAEKDYKRWLVRRPFDPTRKRYYFFQVDLTNAGDFKVLNIMAWGQEFGAPIGHRKCLRVPAGKNIEGDNAEYERYYGLPRLPEPVQLKVALRKKPVDFYNHGGIFFVSSRAKRLLESIDPDGFEFAECITTSRRGISIEAPYWIGAVNRVVVDFDRDRSIFINHSAPHLTLPSGRTTVISCAGAFDLRMLPDMPTHYEAFWLMPFGYPIFSEAIVDVFRAEKIRSARFSPLQTPTRQEESRALEWVNADYYSKTLFEMIKHKLDR